MVNKTRRYLSGMKLGLNLELALLPPGHAHNLTDAFFARVNGLFDKTKQNSRLVGSHACAHFLFEGVPVLLVSCPALMCTQQPTRP